MSSYLADLARRSLGHLPVAQPRLVSRFEPVAPGAPSLSVPAPETEFVADAGIPAPRPTTPRSRGPVERDADGSRHISPDRPEPPARSREHIDRHSDVQPPSPAPKPNVAPAIPTAVVTRLVERVPGTDARSDVIAAPPIADGAAAATRTVGDREPPSIVTPPVREDTRWHRADERLSALERHLTARYDAPVRTAAPHGSPAAERIAPRPFAREQSSPPSPPIAQPSGSGATTHAASTVHLTIGRIDVRAVSAPPTPRASRRPTPARPSLSLEEYLKQRSSR